MAFPARAIGARAFVGSADHGIQLPCLGKLGQIATKLIEGRGVALPVALTWSGLAQERHGQLTGSQKIGTQTAEDLTANSLLFSEEAQQKMLAADMVVSK